MTKNRNVIRKSYYKKDSFVILKQMVAKQPSLYGLRVTNYGLRLIICFEFVPPDGGLVLGIWNFYSPLPIYMPKISIIIPAWNTEETICECLDSIFAQTFHDFEIIVVNDGSVDNTGKLLENYKDKIKIIDQENRGSNFARNRGWKEARGEYLLFLDSDIVMYKDTLQILYNTLQENPEVSYAYSSFNYGGKKFGLWDFDVARLKKMPYIHTSSLIRAKDFPGFDESIKRLQDWDMWLTMLEKGKVGIRVNKVLMNVALRKQGISEWVPRWVYWIPWKWLPWAPSRVRKYLDAVELVKNKHGL